MTLVNNLDKKGQKVTNRIDRSIFLMRKGKQGQSEKWEVVH